MKQFNLGYKEAAFVLMALKEQLAAWNRQDLNLLSEDELADFQNDRLYVEILAGGLEAFLDEFNLGAGE